MKYNKRTEKKSCNSTVSIVRDNKNNIIDKVLVVNVNQRNKRNTKIARRIAISNI